MMARMRVSTPSGDEWRVRRRVWTWKRPKWRGKDLDDWGGDWGGGDDLLGVVALLLLVVLAFFLVIPLAVFLVELLVVALLAFLAAVARVAFGGAWLVEAVGPGRQRLTWKVKGRAASRAKVNEVAEALRSGQEPRR